MSDLSDLHGIFPTSVRWNAEQGFLSAAIYDPTTGGRELQPFEFGQESTFAMDLATRMRGYGMIRVGVYDMRLTPPLSFSSSLILFAIEGAPISLLRRVERFQRAGNCGKSGREPGNRDQAAVF